MTEENDKPATGDAATKVKSYPVDKVITFRNLAVFSTFLSLTFQSSRLFAISPPLASYITIGDAALKLIVAMPIIGIFLFVVIMMMENFSSRLAKGKGYDDSLVQSLVNTLVTSGLTVIILFIGYLIYRFSTSNITAERIWLVSRSFLGIIVFFSFAYASTRAMWVIAVVRHRTETLNRIVHLDFMALIVIGLGGALIGGMLSGFYNRPEYCAVKTPDGTQDAYLLAVLQEVTALKIDGHRVIMKNSQILQLDCDIPHPNADALR